MVSSAGTLALEEATIADMHAAYRAGTRTVHAVIAACLARIAAYDKDGPYLNALITVNAQALAEADAIDAASQASGTFRGPLHGIPVIVKDNLDAIGMPMTAGFQGWKKYYPLRDAPVVAKIKAAGGIILAKASLSEFAKGGGDNINSVLPGFARNPYNTLYATGGSSGGTAAALAANFGVVGIGTDTGGSVRMPAAHNALVGLRPTVGLVSRTGVVPLDGVRDTAGPMARTVTDMTILLEVIVGPDPEDAATARSAGHIPSGYQPFLKQDGLRQVRLGVLRQVFAPQVTDPRILAHFEQTIAELKAAGAVIVDPLLVPALDTIPRPPQTNAQFQTDLTRWIAHHPGVPYPSVQAIAASKLLHPLHQQSFDEAVEALPAEQDSATIAGRQNEARFREAFMQAMDAAQVEALIFPTWAQLPAINGDRNTQITDDPQPAPHAGPTHLGSSLTFVGSMLQWPALSVPNGYINGLPTGLHILARAWDEAELIQYAYAYEQATHYRQPPSTVPPLALLGQREEGRGVSCRMEDEEMPQSTDRILTTHAGSLPMPADLHAMLRAKEAGQPYDAPALQTRLTRAVAEVVQQQAEHGLDIISDGEQSKTSFTTYVSERLAGIETRPGAVARAVSDRQRQDFPEYFAAQRAAAPGIGRRQFYCVGPLQYIGQKAVQTDIANLQSAMAGVQVEEAFLPAVAVGTVEHWIANAYYPSDEAFLFALADSLHEEYKAIIEAGFILQLDNPNLPDGFGLYTHLDVPAYHTFQELRIAALNRSIAGLPASRIRMHVCWGAHKGPHNTDIPLKDIVDLMLDVQVEAYSVEAANPRHAHEWHLWEHIKLPAGKILIPGVVGHDSDTIEHPELVAERICNYASVVGRDNVIAGTDCGFGTSRLHPTIAYLKLQTLVEGARLASQKLWDR